MLNNKNLFQKLSKKSLIPIDQFDYCVQHPCGLPEDCLCTKIKERKVYRLVEENGSSNRRQRKMCQKCNLIECNCPQRDDDYKMQCYRECKTNDSGALCVCAEVCTCDSAEECYVNSMGCVCVPDCTCGWTDYVEKSKKATILYVNCKCGMQCACYVKKQEAYRVPLLMKIPNECLCGATCPCDNKEACYFRQVKEKGLCVCGSGLYFTDCACFNKEYCYAGKWPPCACPGECACPNRETCFLQSRMGKCENCEAFCICGHKEFCKKIVLKKSKCVCNLIDGCTCFDTDQCVYTDKLIRLPCTFTDDIGWPIEPIQRILPINYPTYNANGALKTPYATSVLIKFVNRQKEVMVKHPFQITATVSVLRRDLSIIFKLPLDAIVLKSGGQILHQTVLVAQLGCEPYDVIELFLDVKNALVPIPDYYAMVIPDVITIRINLGENIHKDVVVEIEDRRIDKPFLGGYRHKKTGIEYHHAYTQTGVRRTKIPHELQTNRDTQTCLWRNRSQETTYDRGTQMTNNHIWVPTLGDKIMSYSGKYEDSDAWMERCNIEGKVLTIQRYFRAWKMRKALQSFHSEYVQRVRDAAMSEADRIMIDRKRRQEEMVRKIYPRSRADYSMLYGMLARWKKDETERICQTYTKAPRVAELYILLDREIKILNIIEQHRREVREDMKSQKDIDFFEEISAPIKWHGYNNLLIEMHTEKTQRAQKYKELYFALCRRDLPDDQRLTLLLSLKYALKDHNCRMALEIVSLIDQECELLVRGLGTKELDMLRKRIELLLLEHVKSVQCNDCLTKRYRGVREIRMNKGLFYCKRCQKLKELSQFPLHSRMDQPEYCTNCEFTDVSSKPHVDIAPYRFMLEMIVREERSKTKNADSCIIYMINERDIQYIVDRIWHGHSILTESRDMYDLRLARWRVDEPWSPWNCVLLTELEAKAHSDVSNVTDVYGEHVCNDVANKHLLGRKKFVQMFYVNEFFVNTGTMKDYTETIDYTPVPSEIFCNELCTEPDRGAPCVSEKCLTSNDPKNNVQSFNSK